MFMRKEASQIALAVSLSIAPSFATPAQALKINIKSVVKDIGNIANQVTKLPNPITTPIQIVTGKQNPLEVKDYIKQQGAALGSITNSTRNITNVPYDAGGQLVSEVGGDKARIVFEFATGPERYQREFAFTAAQSAAGVLAGQDPLVALAMPLAAAIRDAHSKYSAAAKPFPPEVKSLLGQVIPTDILERARYTVGDLKISLPSIIANGAKLFGEDELAVTIDDIIVFPRNIDFNDINDLVWTGHELFHVKQYRDWGVDQFAFNYLKNSRAVEDQAKAAASYVRSFLNQIANAQPINPQVTYVGASAFAAKQVQTPLGLATVMTELENDHSTPGLPANNGVLQPVYINPINTNFAAVCVLNNERLYVTKDDTIIAPMRGYIPFGKKIKPGQSPQCYFDLQFPAGRACAQEVTSIDPATGATLYGYEVSAGPYYLGRCAGCLPGQCN
jgi:hypothetical protein